MVARAETEAGELTMEPKSERSTDDTTPQARNVQHELYRQMSPAEKLTLVFETYQTGKQLAMAGIKMRNPHASDEEIWHLWARQNLGTESYDMAYGAMSCE
jgi:hypothetical protein